jgi:SNF2 family DNA or RNA helicase
MREAPYDYVKPSPHDSIKSLLPVTLYPYQVEAVNELGERDRSGLYFEPGCGKTLTSIAIALYKLRSGIADRVLIIVPPALLANWSRVLDSVSGTDHVVYAGTPKKRSELDLKRPTFVIVGIQIFKSDWQHILTSLDGRRVFGIVDEAQMLKDVSTQNFKKVRDFFRTQQVCLLTGTPVGVPTDAYALIKLVSPSIYTTQYMFESLHVAERDFFNKPVRYYNLDLLNSNLMCNAARVLTEDALPFLPPIQITPIHYDLDPKHLKLYQRIAEEQMVKLEDGGKIDLTSVGALWHALSQIPCGAEHFSCGEVGSTVLDLIAAVLDELQGRKLVIFTHYVRTTELVMAAVSKHGAACLYGKTRDRQAEIDRFVRDAACRVLVLNLKSGSAGLDMLQHVCHDALFVELPYRADTFRQACARLHRDGQKSNTHIRVAVANKTLQVRTWHAVQDNDDLVAQCVRSPKRLRDLLAGAEK